MSQSPTFRIPSTSRLSSFSALARRMAGQPENTLTSGQLAQALPLPEELCMSLINARSSEQARAAAPSPKALSMLLGTDERVGAAAIIAAAGNARDALLDMGRTSEALRMQGVIHAFDPAQPLMVSEPARGMSFQSMRARMQPVAVLSEIGEQARAFLASKQQAAPEVSRPRKMRA